MRSSRGVKRQLARIRNGLTFLHRWLGVVFATLFALWFSSGFVMMYCSFPRIEAAERLARAEILDARRIQVSPEQAIAKCKIAQPARRVLLTMLDGRPAYRFFTGSGQAVVFADTGDQLDSVSEDMSRRIAANWVRQPIGSATFEGTIQEADQWTVNGVFRSYGALRKYVWPDGQETYVSLVTAEVAQHTTRGSRIGAYFGAIPHWLYLAPLRRHRELWTQVVIWSSGIATVVALLGLIVGISRYSPFRRYRTADGLTCFPYTGQKRRHAVVGLVFGLFTCTWAFSGMMSMDPFPGMDRPGSATGRLAEALRSSPVRLADFAAKDARTALNEAALMAKELEFVSIAGEPTYLISESSARMKPIPIRDSPQTGDESARLLSVIAEASLPYKILESRQVTEYETYYIDRHHRLPLPVLLVKLSDSEQSAYYIDPRAARIIQSYTAASRWNRWFYQGLHSLDIPWLYRHRPAWDLVVLVLLAGGSAICFTSLVIGWRVVKKLFN